MGWVKLKKGSISIILVDSIVADKMKKKKKIPVGRLIPTHVSNTSRAQQPFNSSCQATLSSCEEGRPDTWEKRGMEG